MSDLVSVIINVYNCKEYLPTSLESVRQQTYKNLEVILVDDASTDGSGEFCDEFCKQDERFRVIHHEKNTGVSGPRNTGLRVAKGDYIYFMDSDDYIHAEAIEALVDAIKETGLELAVFDYVKTFSLTEDTKYELKDIEPEVISSEKIIYEMLFRKETNERSLRWCVVWNKLYKRTLIEGLWFNHYKSIQDQDFNIRVYKQIKEIAYVPLKLYWYYASPNSRQRNASYYLENRYSEIKHRFCMLDYLAKDGQEKKYRSWVIDYGYRQMLSVRDRMQGSEYEKPFADTTKEIIGNTIWEFLISPYVSFVKKVRFLFFWYCQFLSKIYVKLFYGK